MNAEKIVRALRSCGGGPEGMKIARDAADLIESLQAQLDHVTEVKNALESDLINTNGNLEHVTAELSASRRETKAAVEDINGLGRFERERCAYCIHDDECEPGEMLCSYNGDTAFEWRGPQEAGEGVTGNG